MDDVTSLILICGIATAVNTVYQIQNNKNGVTTGLAGGLVFVSLAVLGGLTGRYDIARAFAWLFLLSAAILHGIPLVNSVGQLAQSPNNKKK
jgi:uncharacterized membrane protein